MHVQTVNSTSKKNMKRCKKIYRSRDQKVLPFMNTKKRTRKTRKKMYSRKAATTEKSSSLTFFLESESQIPLHERVAVQRV